ncbi:MAG: MFS transporter [Bacteroidales bacterium]|nr:MFS transporter [Bacteroidales bacterium]
MPRTFNKDLQYYKFCLYGFLKNQRFFEPFLMLYFRELGMSWTQIGTLYAIREITRNIFEIPSGMIADAFGRRGTMMASFGFYIISFVLYYYAGGYAVLAAACIIFGTGDAFRTGTHKAMIFQYLKMNSWEDQKVHYYGHTRSWSQLGSALSSLVAAAIVFGSGNYSSVFLYSLVPYILDLMLMASYPKVLEGETSNRPEGKIHLVFKRVLMEFVFSFKSIKVLKAITNMSVFSGYYQAVKDYLQPVIQAFALSVPVLLAMDNRRKEAVMIGIIYFLLYFATSFASRSSGQVAERFRKLTKPVNVTLLIGLTTGVIIGISYRLDWLLLSVCLLCFIYILENLRRPMALSYVTELLNQNILASVLSAESQANTVFAAVIAVLFGLFADKYDIGVSFMLVSLILLLIAPLILLKAKNGKKNLMQNQKD